MHSISFWLNLGRALGNASAGQIRIDSSDLTSKLYAPGSLILSTSQATAVVEPIRSPDGSLRQVKAPQALADVVVLSTKSYEVRFYTSGQIGPKDVGTQIYAVSGVPYVIYKFENPDAVPVNSARLRITETRGSLAKVNEYSFDASTSSWTFSKGSGLRQESEVTTTAPNGDRAKTRTISDNTNHVASKVSRTYHTFPWGEELIQEVLDPAGAALTTSYTYYDNVPTTDPNYRRLKQVVSFNGSWEQYSYDSSGRVLKTLRPSLDTTPETSNEALCQVTENIYTTVPDADGDGLPEDCTTIIERTLGQETTRRYRIDWTAQVNFKSEICKRRSDIQCVTSGVTWNAASNLVNDTLSYASGLFTDRVRRMLSSDGTASFSSYAMDSSGRLTTTIRQGQPNASKDDIVEGRQVISVTSSMGQITSESTTDIASNLLVGSWSASSVDSLGRPTRLDYNHGT